MLSKAAKGSEDISSLSHRRSNMGVSEILQTTTSAASVLPSSISASIALWETRLALQNGHPNRAAAVAQRQIADLKNAFASRAALAPGFRYLPALCAAFETLLATAQKRAGVESPDLQRNFQIADSAFAALIASEEFLVIPFLSDYLVMLSECDALETALQVTERLSKIAQTVASVDRTVAFTWLRAAMSSLTPAMVLEVGVFLRTQKRSSEAFEVFIHTAGIGLASNDHLNAAEAIESALAIFPGDGNARRVRGLLRWLSGDIKGAQDDFVAAVASNPEDMGSRVALAHAFLRQQQLKDAADELTIVLSRDPGNVDALWLYGDTELRMGEAEAEKDKPEEARKHWEAAFASTSKALQRQPEHTACRCSRAIASYHLGELSNALCDLKEALKLAPSDVDCHGWRAAVLLASGQDSEALSAANLALAFTPEDKTLDKKRGWLLGLKGRALLRMEWDEEAIPILVEALELDRGDKDIALSVVDVYKSRRDWKSLARWARQLQTDAYAADFVVRLRKEEIKALRNLEDYGQAFEAFHREPALDRNDPEVQWIHARVLSDIGDFEAARTILHDPSTSKRRAFEHLSLAGWIFQNLEARDSKDRKSLGKGAQRLYQAALESAANKSPKTADTLWPLKGLANALLRAGSKLQALKTYQQVISECKRRIRLDVAYPRIFALVGWCYHCMEDHGAAAQYYEAAKDKGEQSIGVEFDSALVLLAADGKSAMFTRSALDGYCNALVRARSENILRRIGVLRVALHDVRELLFRAPGLPYCTEIKQLLYAELLESLEQTPFPLTGLKEHLSAFLELINSELPPASVREREALNLKLEAALLLKGGRLAEAAERLDKAGQICSALNSSVWIPLIWRDLAAALTSWKDADKAHLAICRALETGVYVHDPDRARAFIKAITRRALVSTDGGVYRSLIRKAFLPVGPARAFVDAARIVATMSHLEHRFFSSTVLALFLKHYDKDWIYVRDAETSYEEKVPNDDRTFSPFREDLPEGEFGSLEQDLLAVS